MDACVVFLTLALCSASYFFNKSRNRVSERITIPLYMIQDSLRLNLWHSFLAQSKANDGNIKQAVYAQNWSQKEMAVWRWNKFAQFIGSPYVLKT
jgi:hypothetical protein